MKLAVLNLTGGGVSGGYRRYLEGMLPRLAGAAEVSAILCASPAGFSAGGWLPRHEKIKHAACEPFRPFRHAPGPALKAALDAFGPDLLFIPIERRLDYGRVPVVTMLQNMGPISGVMGGAGLLENFRCRIQAYETGQALRRAAAVITPTEYVKSAAAAYFSLPAKKFTAIRYGSTPPATPRKPDGRDLGGGGMVFTAGSFEVYRGFEDLLAVMPPLRAKFPALKLAVAGSARPAGEAYRARLERLAEATCPAGSVVWLGGIAAEGMAWCYLNASAFVMTSRMESFGFTALEAMACGCNIVSADASCLPEVLGECPAYYVPGDAAGLAAALEKVLSRGKGEREAAAAAARARAASFSWDAAASLTLGVFRSAVGG